MSRSWWKKIWFMGIVGAALSSPFLTAGQSTEGWSLDTARASFEKATEEIEQAYQAQKKNREGVYLQALKSTKTATQQSGNLKYLTALNQAIKDFETERTILNYNDDAFPLSVCQAAYALTKANHAEQADKASKLSALKTKYEGMLEKAENILRSAGNLTLATQIKREIERSRVGEPNAHFRARMDINQQQATLRMFTGKYSQVMERGIQRGLKFLMENQQENGAWTSGENPEANANEVGHTGLVLLAFLAHGETPKSPLYGSTIEKGLQFLQSKVSHNGLLRVSKSHSGIYEHCFATYAIAEAYGMTHAPELRPIMTTNLQRIIDGQQKSGGWDYDFADKGRNDTSVMGWAIQTLLAGERAGADNPGLTDALHRSISALKKMQKKSTGKFGYSSPGAGDIGLTGAGVWCLQLLGAGSDPAVKKGLAVLDDIPPAYRGLTHHPSYAFYYITQAKFQAGGSTWERWVEKFALSSLSIQRKDGSWNPETKRKYGAVYCTAFATLTLQTPYRFPLVIPK